MLVENSDAVPIRRGCHVDTSLAPWECHGCRSFLNRNSHEAWVESEEKKETIVPEAGGRSRMLR